MFQIWIRVSLKNNTRLEFQRPSISEFKYMGTKERKVRGKVCVRTMKQWRRISNEMPDKGCKTGDGISGR